MSVQQSDGGQDSVDYEVLELLRGKDKPFVTATEIADALDITRQYAHKRLSELETCGEIKKQNVGAKAVVWWVPD